MTTALPIIFGEALVDAFAEGPVPGGAPFNVACHLAALQLAPLMITRLGDDAAGAAIRAAATRCGLSLAHAQRDDHTAQVRVYEGADGHVFEIPADQAFDRIDADAALAACRVERPEAPAWLYFGTLALRSPCSRTALTALRAIRPHRAFVDLNWREAGPPPGVILDLLHDIEVLKLSDAELRQLLAWLNLPTVPGVPQAGDQRDAIAALCQHTGARQLLVSHGADGAAAWNAQGECMVRAVAPPLPQLIDTVGAGDAFSAMMLAGLLYGHPVQRMLKQAVAFASLSCGWRGALPPTTSPYPSWHAALSATRSPSPESDR